MEWLDKMNEAIDFIESGLTERLDIDGAARMACCSVSRFQRMFAFVADTTVSDYVRCRRMSLSAKEFLESDVRVTDLALKYGYESPEAFTRAFQAFHGVPPTVARKLGIRTEYPRLSFRMTINGGNFNMGTKPLVRIEEHGGGRVVSFDADCPGPEGAAWGMMRDWAVANLSDYAARRFVGCAPKGHHPKGDGHGKDEGEGSHPYRAQMFLMGDEGRDGTFHGAPVVESPSGLFLVGDVAMNEFNSDGSIDIGTSMQKAYGIMSECLAGMGGYRFELEARPYHEEHVFQHEWFTGAGDLAGFMLWLPIARV